MDELILTYVPESEYLDYDEALTLAEKRDEQAADAFMQSVPAGVFPYSYDEALHKRLADAERAASKRPVLVTRMPEEEKKFLQGPEFLKIHGEWTTLTPPSNPREVWGKI